MRVTDTAVHDNANEEIITCESEVEEEEDTSIEYGENDCHLCTFKFNCIEDLSKHLQSNHTERYQKVSEEAYELGTKADEENCDVRYRILPSGITSFANTNNYTGQERNICTCNGSHVHYTVRVFTSKQ